MKKIINGKMYNTDTADLLCRYQGGGTVRDFDWYMESLYRTKRGAYFMYGEGNARSPYSQVCGQNEWCGGDGWEVFTEAQAKEFIELHGSTEEYISAFGEPEEA